MTFAKLENVNLWFFYGNFNPIAMPPSIRNDVFLLLVKYYLQNQTTMGGWSFRYNLGDCPRLAWAGSNRIWNNLKFL